MDVGGWLRDLGLGQYEQAFRDNDIDAGLLPTLTADDLREIGVASLGHRKHLLAAIATLAPPASTAQAERRQLTVMFVDLVGSTALASRLDPEDMREVIRAYQNAVAGEVARFEGHVAKFMGDGVLAYFGWPRAHEDEAERAVRGGLAVVAAVARLATPAREPLAGRVGIATGLVVVGDLVGEGAAQEEACVGETPNLAARLQEAAEPGGVVVAEGTRRFLGEVFELHPLGPTRLKGLAHPVQAFQVVGERPADNRFEAHRPGRLPPMVGRDQELALVLERWRQAAAGEGQAVLLIGEAGIGKSRLVRAVLDAIESEEHAALRYQCSPYHTGTAFWPVIRQLSFAAGLEAADNDVARLDKLATLLRQGADDVTEVMPLVAGLLGIDAGGRYPVPDLTPQQQRARTLAVLVDQLLGLAQRRPVLMVLEDAHWSDPTTLEAVGLALDRIAGARVLMLLTSRPDNQPALGGHPHVTRLTLNRLGRSPTKAIVAHLAGDQQLPPAVSGEIAVRTDGVPLFVEELTKAVLEAGTTEVGATVPASLHASLMARLDRVSSAKEVAQAAACIGREFAYPLLAAVSPVPEGELRAALERLAAAELVFVRGELPEASYSFKHALVRDAAHESLLKSRRRELHACIVATLERELPERAAAELLAWHCTEAGLVERAIDYWQRAGEGAVKRSANLEAVAHFRHALEMLETLPHRAARAEQELRLLLALGPALITTRPSGAPEVGRVYLRARELARAMGRWAELFPAVFGSWLGAFSLGDVPTTGQLVDELFDVAREQDDPGLMLQAHHAAWAVARTRGDLGAAWHHAKAGLSLYKQDKDVHGRHVHMYMGHDPGVCGYMYGALARLLSGYPVQAGDLLDQGLVLARDLGHPPTLVHALWFAAELRQVQREPEVVDELAAALAPLLAEHGSAVSVANAVMLRGWARAALGQIKEGLAELREGLVAWRATGSRLNFSSRLAPVADVYRMAGGVEEGLAVIAEAAEVADRNGERWYDAELHRLRGDLLLLAGSTEEAEAFYRQAVAVAQGQGARLLELRATTSLVRLWRDQGRRSEARDLLASVYGWFAEGFDTPDLQDTRALLDELQ